MGDMMKVIFYTRNTKINGAGLVPIYLRVTANGQRFNAATGRTVKKGKWLKKAERHSGNLPEDQELNDFLATLRNKAFSIQKKLINLDRPVTIKEFEREWHGKKETPHLLLEIFEQHNSEVKQLIGAQYSWATWRRYHTSLKHTRQFLMDKYSLSDISVKQIQYKFITDYEFWLKTVHKCNHNSTIKYLTNFKKIIHICLKNAWLDRDPFVGYKMTKREVERPYLTEEELQILSAKTFMIPRVGQIRDIFLFCCYTGLAYVDVQKLTNSEISTGHATTNAENVLKNRKAVCIGYATLLKEMCAIAGIECEIINGYSKTTINDINRKLSKTDHAWNAVKLYGRWYLLDATWGTGFFDEKRKKTIKHFVELYYLTPPNNFIKTHFPTDKKWQLLGKPITKLSFTRMAIYYNGYFENNISNLLPGNGLIKLNLKDTLEIKFTDCLIIDRPTIQLSDGQFVYHPRFRKENCHYTVSQKLDRLGPYKLTLFIGRDAIVAYKIIIER